MVFVQLLGILYHHVFLSTKTAVPPPPIWDEPRPVPFFGNFMRRGNGGFGGVARLAGAGPMMAFDAMPMAAPERSMSVDSAPVFDFKQITLKEDLAPVTRTRKLFPETWLWESTTVESVSTHHHACFWIGIFHSFLQHAWVCFLNIFPEVCLRRLSAWFGPDREVR